MILFVHYMTGLNDESSSCGYICCGCSERIIIGLHTGSLYDVIQVARDVTQPNVAHHILVNRIKFKTHSVCCYNCKCLVNGNALYVHVIEVVICWCVVGGLFSSTAVWCVFIVNWRDCSRLFLHLLHYTIHPSADVLTATHCTADWKRPSGRAQRTWIHTTEDTGSSNIAVEFTSLGRLLWKSLRPSAWTVIAAVSIREQVE